jgi:poly(3-hydroxybutyrate) depolymerase
MIRRYLLTVAIGGLALYGQAPRVNPERAPETQEQILQANAARYDYRPDVMILNQMVQALRPAANLSDAGKAEVDALARQAAGLQRSGNSGDARRALSQAITLQLGRTWDSKAEYSASLVLRTDATVADGARPYIAQLAQRFPMRYKASGDLRLRVSLAEGGLPGRSDVVVATGRVIQEIGTFDLPSRDLIDDPFRFAADLRKQPEGAYLIMAEVLDGGTPVGHLVTPVYLVQNFEARGTAVRARMAKIQGHESAKATIEYPWDLARGLNTATREVNSFDFGLAVKHSEELLKSLESGKDPLYQATGDNRRNYYFTEAGEVMPYRIYVPKSWAPGKKMPMILALHGSQLDESNFITRANAAMCRMADKYGYIVAAPLGYRINGGYGRRNAPPSRDGFASMMSQPPQVGDLSEKDAMNVMELVAAEYNVDRSRIFIMGNSMGGMGTFLLGAKYAEKFAGMAPCGAGIGDTATYPFERLKGMPLMLVIGELDPGLQRALDTAKALKEHGLDIDLEEVKGGTHPTAVEIMIPGIYQFFNTHQRKAVQAVSGPAAN